MPEKAAALDGFIGDCKTNVQVNLFRANFEKLLCIRA